MGSIVAMASKPKVRERARQNAKPGSDGTLILASVIVHPPARLSYQSSSLSVGGASQAPVIARRTALAITARRQNGLRKSPGQRMARAPASHRTPTRGVPVKDGPGAKARRGSRSRGAALYETSAMIETQDIRAATAAAAKKNVSQSIRASRCRFGSMVPSWMNRLPARGHDEPGLWQGWGRNPA